MQPLRIVAPVMTVLAGLGQKANDTFSAPTGIPISFQMLPLAQFTVQRLGLLRDLLPPSADRGYDALVASSTAFGDAAQVPGKLSDLSYLVAGDRALAWNDILPAFRAGAVMYDGGVTALPLAPSPNMLFYRTDLFEQQTAGPSHGVLWDPDTAQPLVNNEAGEAAIKEINLGSPEMRVNRGRTGFALMPGSTRVLNRASGRLEPCDQRLCPLATDTAPDSFYAYQLASMLASVSLAGWGRDLLLANNELLPMREDDLSPAHLPHWVQAGYDEGDVTRFLAAYRLTAASENSSPDIKIRLSTNVTAAMLAAGVAAGSPSATPESLAAVLPTLERALLGIVAAEGGPEAFLAQYRRSINNIDSNVQPDARAAQPKGQGDSLSTWELALAVALPCAAALAALAGAVAFVTMKWRRGLAKASRGQGTAPPGPGPLSLVVTDIEDSTRLWEWEGLAADVMDAALRLHQRVLREAALEHRGYESATEGDSFILAFGSPVDAVAFCLAAQQGLLEAAWPQELLALQPPPQGSASGTDTAGDSDHFSTATSLTGLDRDVGPHWLDPWATPVTEVWMTSRSARTSTGGAVMNSGGACTEGADPSSLGAVRPVLVFRGLRVRMGVASGLALPADVTVNVASGRMCYGGAVLRLARAVSDAAQGGAVLVCPETQAALDGGGGADATTATLGRAAGGSAVVLWMGGWRLGDYEEAAHVFQVIGSPLLGRLALQLSRPASDSHVQPLGVQQGTMHLELSTGSHPSSPLSPACLPLVTRPTSLPSINHMDTCGSAGLLRTRSRLGLSHRQQLETAAHVHIAPLLRKAVPVRPLAGVLEAPVTGPGCLARLSVVGAATLLAWNEPAARRALGLLHEALVEGLRAAEAEAAQAADAEAAEAESLLETTVSTFHGGFHGGRSCRRGGIYVFEGAAGLAGPAGGAGHLPPRSDSVEQGLGAAGAAPASAATAAAESDTSAAGDNDARDAPRSKWLGSLGRAICCREQSTVAGSGAREPSDRRRALAKMRLRAGPAAGVPVGVMTAAIAAPPCVAARWLLAVIERLPSLDWPPELLEHPLAEEVLLLPAATPLPGTPGHDASSHSAAGAERNASPEVRWRGLRAAGTFVWGELGGSLATAGAAGLSGHIDYRGPAMTALASTTAVAPAGQPLRIVAPVMTVLEALGKTANDTFSVPTGIPISFQMVSLSQFTVVRPGLLRDPLPPSADRGYDALVATANAFGDVAQIPGKLSDLSYLVAGDRALAWNDILPAFRAGAVMYNGGVVALPLAPTPNMLYYRTDLFEQQTAGPSHGVLWDPVTAQPLVNTEAGGAAIKVFLRLMAVHPNTSDAPVCQPDSFSRGRCFLSLNSAQRVKEINLGSPELRVNRGRTGFALMPGSTRVLNRASGRLEPCDRRLCPLATDTAPDAFYAYQLVSMLASVSLAGSGRDLLLANNELLPMREDDLSPAHLPHWVQAGYDEGDVTRFLAAYRLTAASENSSPDIKICLSTNVTAAMLAAGVAAGSPSATPESLAAVLPTLERALLGIVAAEGGPEAFLAQYRRSINNIDSNVQPDARAAQPKGQGDSLSTWELALAVALPCAAALAALAGAVAFVTMKWRRGLAKASRGQGTAPPGPGPLSLVVTDIEDSTRLWEWEGLAADVMDAALRLHQRVLREAALEHRGYESATEGDSFILAFGSPVDAVAFCLAAQQGLLEAAWPQELLALQPPPQGSASGTDTAGDSDHFSTATSLTGLDRDVEPRWLDPWATPVTEVWMTSRVRMGVASGLALPADVTVNVASGRMCYGGAVQRLARAVSDSVQGGAVLVCPETQAALDGGGGADATTATLGRAAGGSAVVLWMGGWRLGDYEEAAHVFQVIGSPLLGRLALQLSRPASDSHVQPLGVQQGTMHLELSTGSHPSSPLSPACLPLVTRPASLPSFHHMDTCGSAGLLRTRSRLGLSHRQQLETAAHVHIAPLLRKAVPVRPLAGVLEAPVTGPGCLARLSVVGAATLLAWNEPAARRALGLLHEALVEGLRAAEAEAAQAADAEAAEAESLLETTVSTFHGGFHGGRSCRRGGIYVFEGAAGLAGPAGGAGHLPPRSDSVEQGLGAAGAAPASAATAAAESDTSAAGDNDARDAQQTKWSGSLGRALCGREQSTVAGSGAREPSDRRRALAKMRLRAGPAAGGHVGVMTAAIAAPPCVAARWLLEVIERLPSLDWPPELLEHPLAEEVLLLPAATPLPGTPGHDASSHPAAGADRDAAPEVRWRGLRAAGTFVWGELGGSLATAGAAGLSGHMEYRGPAMTALARTAAVAPAGQVTTDPTTALMLPRDLAARLVVPRPKAEQEPRR
ncbi:hypothetical protein HYH03_006593 [Edaphochlamys debaryana]|uniref:Guanylate cyclase domain-containing protein n=1 Tax=Edaphochlamys debaryana TaxID=47281 RepID=A0A835Y5X9_9CHLO|nr:hypothetical protein HYH03_006593 [Edaphochlamys debaryana]|eukprot:KAG2495323.1 hypothetical protein HYH03_006593 [Edaphochlamys debaryana]